jgi:carboxyl-terminal processing protease
VKKLLLAALGMTACFSFGYFWKDIRNGQFPGAKKDLLFGIRTTKGMKPEQAFKDVYTRIVNSFHKRVDRADMKYAAMEGLVASLGDPHTNFFVPKINTAFKDETTGRFFGIGARLQPDPLGVKVVNVFADGPAMKAGILAGDVITVVDGKNVAGMESDDVVLLIKGQENTTVRLKIIRSNAKEPIDFVIKRAKVVPPSVESKVFDQEKIGYVKILNFSQEVPDQFDQEWDRVEKSSIQGLVIDLRGNPGGSLEGTVRMLSRFIDDKVAVTLKFREKGEEEVYETSKGDTHDYRYPIAILIDEESASAAEILAGVLRDYGKAKLLGERSYGKFSVQTVFNQIDGAGIKLTIARYFLPKSGAKSRKVDEDGTYISGGLEPDIPVKINEDLDFEPGNVEKDPTLARAIQYLKTGK